jgi:hypothetical protein
MEQEQQQERHPELVEILQAELQELAAIGISLKNKIASAKTKPKKALYLKKQERNSKRAAEILLYLERVQISQAIKRGRQNQEMIDERTSDEHTPTGENTSSESNRPQV